MENLVIRLGSTPSDNVHWVVWSAQQQEIIASGVLDDASQLASLSERAGQRPITALIPGCDVLLKWVTMPAKASRKALSAIPYILEEELSTDISQQFFALGDRKGILQAVAVVNKQKMHAWLSAIKDAGLYCDKLLPDVLAVPFEADTWSLLTMGQQGIIRQDEWQGLQGDISWLLPAVEHYAKQQATPLKIANHSDQSLSHLANVEDLPQQLDMPMQLLATGALKSPFNLLQGDFKVKKKSSGNWRQWQVAAVLAILALIVTVTDKSLQLTQLQQESKALTAKMQAEYKRAFPNAGQPRFVKAAMEKGMTRLESGGGTISMVTMLAQLGDAFESSQVKPQTLRFDSNRSELRMQVAAKNFEALERFKRLAEEKGFEIQQGAINNKDNQLIGSLTIRS
ncbi:type II secretion system protein GspL [Aliiglaciecola sp. LCG003]|uniref:type II secretion system protein GspL n=1 Tax=Aliiglaciecola sp. LCG003 TaxID=3053655 RepID=UPI002573F6A5|nr:type II secretion system protein GspL [Aliiglaciecola sp. LCG003]WJG09303.1 type II secretion system protein GspL [Aliiglaciecola sp. LCG003]